MQAAKKVIAEYVADYSLPVLLEKNPQLVENIKKEHQDPKIFLYQETIKLYDVGIEALPTGPHLTCFSMHTERHHIENGLLSMWRSYCTKGDGIALGFNTQKLVDKTNALIKSHKFGTLPLLDVAYSHQTEKIEKRIKASHRLPELLIRTVAKLSGNLTTEEFASPFIDVLGLAMSTKDADFEDEREVRLLSVVVNDSSTSEKLQPKMVGDKILIEYLDCLETIMIGPTNNPQGIYDMVWCALQRANRTDVEIVKSETSFRFL